MPIPQMTAFFPQPVCKHSSFWSFLRDADSLFACHHHMQRLTDSTTISGRLTNSVLLPDAPFTTQLARTHLGYRDSTPLLFFCLEQTPVYNVQSTSSSCKPRAQRTVARSPPYHLPRRMGGEWSGSANPGVSKRLAGAFLSCMGRCRCFPPTHHSKRSERSEAGGRRRRGKRTWKAKNKKVGRKNRG